MARTGGSKKNDPFAVRAAPPSGGLMKLKPKAKLKGIWKPFDLGDPDIGANERDEIMDEFGHRLPDPVWLRVNPGKQDGELRFIQYPNRDVSAHTWSDEKYEWVELGRYSCARKIIEGKVMSTEFLHDNATAVLNAPGNCFPAAPGPKHKARSPRTVSLRFPVHYLWISERDRVSYFVITFFA
ncbi:ubiquitin homeostasis protein lub1 [Neofusicoccum parvum]|nr:ubiquitin homeostasis protein lub1 [Neofusicoccum parvum]